MADVCPMCGRDREILVAAVCDRCGFDTRPSPPELSDEPRQASQSADRLERADAENAAEAPPLAQDASGE